MKVHKVPEANKMTRDEWIVAVGRAAADVSAALAERQTGYRDGGATVRIAVTLPDGEHELDFQWRTEQPAEAAAQIREYEYVDGDGYGYGDGSGYGYGDGSGYGYGDSYSTLDGDDE